MPGQEQKQDRIGKHEAMEQYLNDPILHTFVKRMHWEILVPELSMYDRDNRAIMLLADFQRVLQEENRRLNAEVLRLTQLVPAYITADLVPKVKP